MSGNSYLENRPELSNPTNSWRRLVEGIYLQKQGDDVFFYKLVKICFCLIKQCLEIKFLGRI